MRLEVEYDAVQEQPDVDDIRQALRRLSPAGAKFAILDVGPDRYLQTYVLDDGQLDVEYRDGGADRHYQSIHAQPLDAVIDAFLSYLAGDNRWRTAFEWRRLELS